MYGNELLAYVVLHDKNNFSAISIKQKKLALSLPDYMLPRKIILIDSIPLTLSGKIVF